MLLLGLSSVEFLKVKIRDTVALSLSLSPSANDDIALGGIFPSSLGGDNVTSVVINKRQAHVPVDLSVAPVWI